VNQHNVQFECQTHHTFLEGEPELAPLKEGGWVLDTSEMWCPEGDNCNPSNWTIHFTFSNPYHSITSDPSHIQVVIR